MKAAKTGIIKHTNAHTPHHMHLLVCKRATNETSLSSLILPLSLHLIHLVKCLLACHVSTYLCFFLFLTDSEKQQVKKDLLREKENLLQKKQSGYYHISSQLQSGNNNSNGMQAFISIVFSLVRFWCLVLVFAHGVLLFLFLVITAFFFCCSIAPYLLFCCCCYCYY